MPLKLGFPPLLLELLPPLLFVLLVFEPLLLLLLLVLLLVLVWSGSVPMGFHLPFSISSFARLLICSTRWLIFVFSAG